MVCMVRNIIELRRDVWRTDERSNTRNVKIELEFSELHSELEILGDILKNMGFLRNSENLFTSTSTLRLSSEAPLAAAYKASPSVPKPASSKSLSTFSGTRFWKPMKIKWSPLVCHSQLQGLSKNYHQSQNAPSWEILGFWDGWWWYWWWC